MHIAFVAESDPENVLAWSGIPYHMLRTLRANFEQVTVVRQPPYDRTHPQLLSHLRDIAAAVSRDVRRLGVDAVLFQGTSALAYFDTDWPAMYWHDSTWGALYGGFFAERLSFEEFKRKYPGLHEWDKLVLQRAHRIFFSSDWLVEHAVRDYGIAADKLQVLPFGANLKEAPEWAAVDEFVDSRSFDRCQLLFSGVDWRRKGLRPAIALSRELRRRGLPTVLNVVGAKPKRLKIRLARGVKLHGFLRKSSPEDSALLEELMRTSHFLVHPAHFECYGCALVEANAYGLPVIGTRVGGLTTIVRDDVNGALFDEDEFVDRAADYIETRFAQGPARYKEFARTSWGEFDGRLRWEVQGAVLRRDIERLCGVAR